MFEMCKPRRTVPGVWFFVCLLLGNCCALPPAHADKTAPKDAPRALSFHVAVDCICASCVFDTQRDLKKFVGVKSAKFNSKARRIDVEFTEGARSVSELAQAVVKSDIGKGASLCWSVPPGQNEESLVKTLAAVPGVQNARLDKPGLILIAFNAAPTVTLKQLDDATQGGGQ